jgi:putative membrane protein
MRAVMLDWSFQPWEVACVSIGALWYLLGLLRMYRRGGPAGAIGKGQEAAFLGGILAVILALMSPIDAIGEQLFSVHMLQHLLLMMAAAPLFAWSRPALVFLWALPRKGRKGMGRAWSGLGLRGSVRGLMHPITVWLLFSGAFVFWHCPRPYTWALQNDAVHAVEHLCFFVTALMFWTIVFEPDGHRRLGYGGTVVFVSTTAVLSSLPGALMVLAPAPLYPVHAEGVAAWQMTLLQDQQLAGVIMWIPAGSVYLAAVCFLFVRWIGEPTPRPVARRRHALLLPVLLLSPVPLLSSCKDHGSRAVSSNLGNARHGAALIRQFGCGSCHLVPGIDGAMGVVGPPLMQVGRRIYIAGVLRNTPPNLVRWLRDPQLVVPGNAMPNMHIDEPDARDVAAYLYTLR